MKVDSEEQQTELSCLTALSLKKCKGSHSVPDKRGVAVDRKLLMVCWEQCRFDPLGFLVDTLPLKPIWNPGLAAICYLSL